MESRAKKNGIRKGESSSTIDHSSTLSNANLSEQQKSAKKQLKRQLKLQTRLRKYRVQHRLALERREYNVAQKAAEQYNTLIEQNPDTVLLSGVEKLSSDVQNCQSANDCASNVPAVGKRARKIVEDLYHRFQSRLNNSPSAVVERAGERTEKTVDAAAKKEQWYQKSREMIKHMHHGTLEPHLCNDPDALRGYTRQKFVERAMLVVHSFQKLEHVRERIDDAVCLKRIWERLNSVRTILSLGCGPGGDCVGALSFLHCHRKETGRNGPPPHLVLLDFAIGQWSLLLKPLHEELLVYKTEESNSSLISELEMAECDVRQPLLHEETDDSHRGPGSVNARAKELILNNRFRSDGTQLVLVSYLLSETNGRWFPLFDDLMKTKRTASLILLLTDPTAWQLHIFLERYRDYIERHVWLDSSMLEPGLQGLDRRVGPASLLVSRIIDERTMDEQLRAG